MSIHFKPTIEAEVEYDKKARLYIRGVKEDKRDLRNNIVDLSDLDDSFAKQGEP